MTCRTRSTSTTTFLRPRAPAATHAHDIEHAHRPRHAEDADPDRHRHRHLHIHLHIHRYIRRHKHRHIRNTQTRSPTLTQTRKKTHGHIQTPNQTRGRRHKHIHRRAHSGAAVRTHTEEVPSRDRHRTSNCNVVRNRAVIVVAVTEQVPGHAHEARQGRACTRTRAPVRVAHGRPARVGAPRHRRKRRGDVPRGADKRVPASHGRTRGGGGGRIARSSEAATLTPARARPPHPRAPRLCSGHGASRSSTCDNRPTPGGPPRRQRETVHI